MPYKMGLLTSHFLAVMALWLTSYLLLMILFVRFPDVIPLDSIFKSFDSASTTVDYNSPYYGIRVSQSYYEEKSLVALVLGFVFSLVSYYKFGFFRQKRGWIIGLGVIAFIFFIMLEIRAEHLFFEDGTQITLPFD